MEIFSKSTLHSKNSVSMACSLLCSSPLLAPSYLLHNFSYYNFSLPIPPIFLAESLLITHCNIVEYWKSHETVQLICRGLKVNTALTAISISMSIPHYHHHNRHHHSDYSLIMKLYRWRRTRRQHCNNNFKFITRKLGHKLH